MPAGVKASHTVEKIMSASREEFARSLAVLLGVSAAPELPARVAVGGGHAAIDYEALPSATLGGLLALPRARVTLAFEDVCPIEAEAFLRRFDLAFQRGGG